MVSPGPELGTSESLLVAIFVNSPFPETLQLFEDPFPDQLGTFKKLRVRHSIVRCPTIPPVSESPPRPHDPEVLRRILRCHPEMLGDCRNTLLSVPEKPHDPKPLLL